MDDIKTGSDLGRTIENFLNGLGDKKAIVACARHLTGYTHRTLQQKVMGLMVACLEQWAQDHDNGNFDARNEATVKLAKKMIDATGDKYDRALPYI